MKTKTKQKNKIHIEVKVSISRAGEFIARVPIYLHDIVDTTYSGDAVPTRDVRDQIEHEAYFALEDKIRIAPLKGEVTRVLKALKARDAADKETK